MLILDICPASGQRAPSPPPPHHPSLTAAACLRLATGGRQRGAESAEFSWQQRDRKCDLKPLFPQLCVLSFLFKPPNTGILWVSFLWQILFFSLSRDSWSLHSCLEAVLVRPSHARTRGKMVPVSGRLSVIWNVSTWGWILSVKIQGLPCGSAGRVWAWRRKKTSLVTQFLSFRWSPYLRTLFMQ